VTQFRGDVTALAVDAEDIEIVATARCVRRRAAPGSHIQFADLTGSGRDDYLDVNPDGSVSAWFNGERPKVPRRRPPAGNLELVGPVMIQLVTARTFGTAGAGTGAPAFPRKRGR
jgi:hypothetical protein